MYSISNLKRLVSLISSAYVFDPDCSFKFNDLSVSVILT